MSSWISSPKAEEYAEGLELDNISLAQTSIIYYTDPKTGEYRELQQLYGTENRIWVSYDDIPLISFMRPFPSRTALPHAQGRGLDPHAGSREGFAGGSSSFGGSTITQQLIKNLSQEDEVTVDRKVQEIFRALEVEKRYTKSEIMGGISTRSTSVRAATVSRVRRASTLARRSPT